MCAFTFLYIRKITSISQQGYICRIDAYKSEECTKHKSKSDLADKQYIYDFCSLTTRPTD